MSELDYPITTDRLTIRPFTEDDLDALHRLHSHPDVARYMYWEPWPRGRTVEALGRRIQTPTLAREGDSLDLAVIRDDTGEFTGEVHLQWLSAEHRRGEIGFAFHPDHHGHGFAREATVEMLRLGFETFGLRRIIGRCDAANAASAGLMERLGMRREAHFVDNEFVKGVWASEYDYAMLASEWPEHGG
ncbi:GNAT family N-acetyltransferase [Jiangella asiatica]|uniref:N-acetyltransferase n=1 Tax=Jiangella asiatica TaxID=2530372 RepID=A0A4R5CKV5_9ACTN|nr:GNAT family N-acetyltransferase [Jiangella asiatica]TDD98074.1 N-acetyltransferase [Jiangella asiatica]